MPRRRLSKKQRQNQEMAQNLQAQEAAEMATLQNDVRARLRAKLRTSRQSRQKSGGQTRPVLSDAVRKGTKSDEQRIRDIASWLLTQVVRDYQQVVHSSASLCLLFHVDLLSEEGWIDGTALGSSVEILLFKVNAAIYFIWSDHMSGLKCRVEQGKQPIKATPENLLYVTNPTQHLNGATAEIEFDLTPIEFVAQDIPIGMISSGDDHEFALDSVHLPTIQQALGSNE